jgi:hypothetical protein
VGGRHLPEKLTELVGGLDDRRVELARLMDRFPLQVHLEPSDISEITSKRVLSKDAGAEKLLRELFTQHRGRLTDNTRMTADIKLPELSTESFIDLYPLLPYQIDLIIQIVSGLRTQAGASRHVGGANRTIIKLAQQLLIHPDVDLADEPVGKLARVDQIYDLVSGNIGSEIRGKIADIGTKIAHPLAQPVAKAICLLLLSDFHVEVIDLLGNKVEAEIGVAFFVAAYSALRKSPPQPAPSVLGDMSLQGNIKPVRSLTEPLQVAMDNGGKRALIPFEKKRQFLEVNADVLEQVDPVFFGDMRQAAFKALGLN